MNVIETAAAMQSFSSALHRKSCTIAFVPTMGALHPGHLSLISCAKEICDETVVSIFVNPTQFGPNEDFNAYPRPLESDISKCREAGVTAVFTPSNGEMYPDPFSTFAEETSLSKQLCGKQRPGHFRGVTTVVLKLFNIVQPDKAVFGKKDAQQARIIQRMARDLNLPVEIVLAPTLRDPDGLAMSSRNKYLSAAERETACCIYKALTAAKSAFQNGSRNSTDIKTAMTDVLKPVQPGLQIEYVEILNSESLEPVDKLSGNILIAIAAKIGSTRLIDNIELSG